MDNKLILSPKQERPCPPKSVCMHVTSILTCMNFLSRFRLIKFFHEREIWSSGISKTEKVTPTKIGVHACDINPYLYEFFEPILIN